MKANSSSGEFIHTTNLKTDENGKSQKIEKLTQDGNLEFEIDKIFVPTGYKLSDNQIGYANYNYETEKLKRLSNSGDYEESEIEEETSNNINVCVDNTNKIINLIIYIEPKTFDFNISKLSTSLGNYLIEGAKFKLEQPKIEETNRNVVI